MKSISYIIVLLLLSSCAGKQIVWQRTGTQEEFSRDMGDCHRRAMNIDAGYYGDKKAKAIEQCLFSYGHKLIEVEKGSVQQ